MSAFDNLYNKIIAVEAQFKAPAIMAVIVRNGGDYNRQVLHGIRKSDAGSDVNNQLKGSDQFCLGSVSKPVSGYLISYLVQKEILRWDTKIIDVFTEFKNSNCRKHFNIREDYLNATVAQMMTHTAYFPWAPSKSIEIILENNKVDINKTYEKEYCNELAVIQRRYSYLLSAQQDPKATFGQYNGGPIIPIAMAERRTQKSYNQLMKEFVFDKLGMTNAVTGRSATGALTPNGVWQHTYDDINKKFIPQISGTFLTTYNYHSHSPAGAVHLSSNDAVQFITALFPKNGKTKKGVNNSTLNECLIPNANGVALSGWFTNGVNGNDLVISHDGDDGTCYCRANIYPMKGYGFMVFTSGGGSGVGKKIVDAVSEEILRMFDNWNTLYPSER
jgi:CubicO group peptidase (beta-lactamase class C family)